MKKFNELILEGTKYLNKTQLYLLSIPYAMYQNYGQYKEDWESLNEDDLNDVKDTQKYLDSMTEDKRVRLSYKGLPPYFQFGIKTICEICLKHKEDYSKLDIKLFKDILEEVS